MNKFSECLVEAYRKKEVNGRYEFNTGKNTKVIVNPQYGDLTTYQYDKNAKRKKKKDDTKKLMESFDVFKRMISKLANESMNQILNSNPKITPEKYFQQRSEIKAELKDIPTDQLVTQFANMKGQQTVVQDAQQKAEEEQKEAQ